jgi:hypothetical protein
MLQQQIEQLYRALPMLRLGILQIRVDDLEAAGEREAETPDDLRQSSFGFLAAGEIEWGQRRQCVQDLPQLDLLVDGSELVNALLQALGDRQIEGLDDVPRIGFRRGFSAQEQVVQLVADEIAVTP